MEQSKIDKFIKEIDEVCQKHNISISHQDGHGCFLLTKYEESLISWLKDADWSDDEYHSGYMDEEEAQHRLANKREY